jgi:hypothetical protein
MSLRDGLVLTAMVLAVSDFSGAASDVLAAQKQQPAATTQQTGAGGASGKDAKPETPRGRPECREGYKMVGGRCLRQPKAAPANCPAGTSLKGGKCVPAKPGK